MNQFKSFKEIFAEFEKTGKAPLLAKASGCANMGSCQCGDVVYYIIWVFNAQKNIVYYNSWNSNWKQEGLHAPYTNLKRHMEKMFPNASFVKDALLM
jgi:hypothetical protein